MSIQTFLDFAVEKHNETLIETLIGLILLMSAFWFYRSFLSGKADESATVAGLPDLSHLEESLKQILEKAAQVPASSAGPGDPNLMAEIGQLKKTLQERQTQIETLKVQVESAGANAGASAATEVPPGMSAEDKSKLEEQIKELQTKLAEYEIISEDIADLSAYKEENARLKKQLEGGGGGSAPPAPKTEPEIVGRSNVPPPAAPAPTPAPPAPKAEPPPATEKADSVDDEIMKEFAEAVESQKAVEAASKSTAVSPGGELDLENLDMDKMLAEAGSLENSDAQVGAEALNQELDAEKLLKEANNMEAAPAGDKELMNEFESFVKKEGAG